MDQHALLMHTLMRQVHPDSPATARRREQMLHLERTAREARRRRRARLAAKAYAAAVRATRALPPALPTSNRGRVS